MHLLANVYNQLLAYEAEHPEESGQLMNLLDRVTRAWEGGRWVPFGNSELCIRSAAVVVDEQDRVLTRLNAVERWDLATGTPHPADRTLRGTAEREIAGAAGIQRITAVHINAPILVVTRPMVSPECAAYPCSTVYYLYRGLADVLTPALRELESARWLPVSQIAMPSLRERLLRHAQSAP